MHTHFFFFLPVSHLVQLTRHCLLLACLSEVMNMLVKVLKDNHGPFHISKAHKTTLVLNQKVSQYNNKIILLMLVPSFPSCMPVKQLTLQ